MCIRAVMLVVCCVQIHSFSNIDVHMFAYMQIFDFLCFLYTIHNIMLLIICYGLLQSPEESTNSVT